MNAKELIKAITVDGYPIAAGGLDSEDCQALRDLDQLMRDMVRVIESECDFWRGNSHEEEKILDRARALGYETEP